MILLTGATGYVGGRLLPALLRRGETVRCLVRRPLPPREGVESVVGDALDRSAVERAMEGARAAYYLIHSMGAAGSFEERDRRAAEIFGTAARQAGARRMVYLGGLGESGPELSAHLRSRQEVGEILRSSGVPAIEFRAAVVIGAGSLSFEMIRALVERLPVMIAPRWVKVPTQPIAVEDLIAYLTSALDLPGEESRVFEIGGADRTSYGGMMREYARQRGLRRLVLPVPVLTPRLSSLWLGLVTPLYVRVGRKLIDSIRHPTVVEDDAAGRAFAIRPRDHRAAIAAALQEEDRELAARAWDENTRFGLRQVDRRTVRVRVPPPQAFAPIQRIGGRAGWYYANWLWKLRGWADSALGGVGLRRGRPNGDPPRAGGIVDFWRVEAFEPDRRLRLRAEMRLPGRAWLEFVVEGDQSGSTIRQTAVFDARGLLGRLYWYVVHPVHALVFRGMLRGLARAAEVDYSR